jgi:hypothetical protein
MKFAASDKDFMSEGALPKNTEADTIYRVRPIVVLLQSGYANVFLGKAVRRSLAWKVTGEHNMPRLILKAHSIYPRLIDFTRKASGYLFYLSDADC